MRPANPWRGEVEISLSGRSHVLRPSFEALAAIETEIAPILKLAEAASDGAARIADMAGVIHRCLMPDTDGTSLERAQVGEGLAEMGYAAAISVYRRLLEAILKGSIDAR
ncbi:MAG: hypothetical protein Tsb008_20550 [Rhodothalassiaceae bacterium]